MAERITEKRIKDILRNKDKKIKSIQNKIQSLYEATDADSILAEVAYPSLDMSGMPGARGTHKDLGDVLITYKKQVYKRNEELKELMWQLTDQMEEINRIWACFHVLDDPYYTILHALYVENQLYTAVETDFGYSHKTFEKHRREGVELIMNFYESGDSIPDLMRKYRKKSSKGKNAALMKKRQAPLDEAYQQISLKELLQ